MVGQVGDGDISLGVALEGPLDEGCSLFVDFHRSSLDAGLKDTGVEISQRCFSWSAASSDLLPHALGYFVGEVLGVELGDGAHDAVHQEAAGSLVDVLAGRDQADTELVELGVDGDVVGTVAGQAIDLVDDDVVDILDRWYRRELKAALPDLVEKWESAMGVKANQITVKRMKTKWGSCNPDSRNIWFNPELAKKNPRSLEYLVVHELAHLIERSHNAKFVAVMDRYLPDWTARRDELNGAPLAAEDWRESNGD